MSATAWIAWFARMHGVAGSYRVTADALIARVHAESTESTAITVKSRGLHENDNRLGRDTDFLSRVCAHRDSIHGVVWDSDLLLFNVEHLAGFLTGFMGTRNGIGNGIGADWTSKLCYVACLSGVSTRRRMEHLMSRALLAMGLVMMMAALGQSAHAAGKQQTKFKHISPQFIAALGDSRATSGTGAESWGLWRQDPGPRGVRVEGYERLKAAGGIAPAKWKFDSTDWWMEEHGLIMEQPDFPVPPGKYLVTGDREVTSVLTIHPKGKDGTQRWELADGAKLFDVTHLGCRSARYTPATSQNSCSPVKAPKAAFPVVPGGRMPPVEGCNKQDYAVLIVIGVAEN
jgi:hypothetical protein